MNKIREHFNNTLLPLESDIQVTDPQPGDLVRNLWNKGDIGVVVEKIDENGVKVLWGEFHDPYSGFIGSPKRNFTQIAKEMFPVQTMHLPQGLIFYLDEMFKKEEK